MQVSELQELSGGVFRTPKVVPVSSLSVTPESVQVDGEDEFAFDADALTNLAPFLKVPLRYVSKCSPELQAANLNYWASGNEGRVAIYHQDNHIVSLADPETKAFPLTTYLDLIASRFDSTDEVQTFISEPGYLHVDVLTDRTVAIPGDSSDHPEEDDVARAGLRIIAYPDLQKPPTVSSYFHRQGNDTGISVAEVSSKISLRGKDLDELSAEISNVVLGLKQDLVLRAEDYRQTADRPIVGKRSQFIYHVAHERKLPNRIIARIMDVSSSLPDEPTVYDVLQVFAKVANDDLPYRHKIILQATAGDFVGRTDQMLDRCATCERPFPDFSKV
jgi:hypothetical protein